MLISYAIESPRTKREESECLHGILRDLPEELNINYAGTQ